MDVRHQRRRRGWEPLPAPRTYQVKRQLAVKDPTSVWLCGITRHWARDGSADCAAETPREAMGPKFDRLSWAVRTPAEVAAYRRVLGEEKHAS